MKLENLREHIRPLTVAVLVAALVLGAVVSGALEAIKPGLGVAFTKGLAGYFRAVPEAFYTLTTVALLGYTAARGAEKMVGIHSTAKYNPPARPVDNPDA